MLAQKLTEEKAAYLKRTYDSVFEDDTIREEQQSTAQWLETIGNEGGQDW